MLSFLLSRFFLLYYALASPFSNSNARLLVSIYIISRIVLSIVANILRKSIITRSIAGRLAVAHAFYNPLSLIYIRLRNVVIYIAHLSIVFVV